MSEYFKLSGEMIDHMINIVQQGILKEQDIIPDLREIRVETDNNMVVLSETSDSRFSDVVFVRVGQIVNEAWITGTNIADHLRMMRMEFDGDSLTLTNEYMGIVEENLRHQVEHAEKLKDEEYDIENDPPTIVRGEN